MAVAVEIQVRSYFQGGVYTYRPICLTPTSIMSIVHLFLEQGAWLVMLIYFICAYK